MNNAQQNLANQQTVVTSAQSAVDAAQAEFDKGSVGFFDYVGNTTAANIIRNRVSTQDNDTWGNTNIGGQGDATSLENMKNAID